MDAAHPAKKNSGRQIVKVDRIIPSNFFMVDFPSVVDGVSWVTF